MEYLYIDKDAQLADFCAQIKTEQYCTVDTEFVREKTYYPILSLIQIASENYMACIDPIVINNFTPLIDLLIYPGLLKVFHSSSQDLEILYQRFGSVPTPVFDTQLAASVLGFNHQIGYADLVSQITDVKLEKKHTRADWSRRPLSKDEIDYAMDDVRYLLPVYRHLNLLLEDKNRNCWLEEDFANMSQASNYEVDMAELWKRLKGIQKLKAVSLKIASELCEWRELKAQQKNLPKRWIAKDEVLIQIARRQTRSKTDLSEIAEITDKFLQRYGNEILEVVNNALKTDETSWPKHDSANAMDANQQALGDCLMALCRSIAEKNQIALATLATRKDIDSLITNRINSRLTQGWRFTMAGEQLLDFIHGQSMLAVQNKNIELVSGKS